MEKNRSAESRELESLVDTRNRPIDRIDFPLYLSASTESSTAIWDTCSELTLQRDTALQNWADNSNVVPRGSYHGAVKSSEMSNNNIRGWERTLHIPATRDSTRKAMQMWRAPMESHAVNPPGRWAVGTFTATWFC